MPTRFGSKNKRQTVRRKSKPFPPDESPFSSSHDSSLSEDLQSSLKSDSNPSVNGEHSSFSSVSPSYVSSLESEKPDPHLPQAQVLKPRTLDHAAAKQTTGNIPAANKAFAVETVEARNVGASSQMIERRGEPQDGGNSSDSTKRIDTTKAAKSKEQFVESTNQNKANVTPPISSGLRLSLSLDGKAKVINGEMSRH